MSTKKSPPGLHEDFPLQVTLALIEFLRATGLSRKSIEAMVSRSFSELDGRTKSRKGTAGVDPGVASIVGAAFHVWFRSRKYLTDSGTQTALKLYGRTDSVESLIAAESPAVPAAKIVSELLRLNLLKRTSGGRYLPTALHSLIRGEHPYLSEHVAHSIIRLISTVRQNSTLPRKDDPLIERFAHVASIPKSKVREFKDFTSQQGEALIDTVNDWLEANKGSVKARRSKKGAADLQAGLHVFAYVGEYDH
jgi:hypothetical protein